MDVDSCTNTEWPFRVVKNNCTSSSPSHLHLMKGLNQWDDEMPLHVAGCSDESRRSKMLKLDWCSDASGQHHKLPPDLCSYRPQFSVKKHHPPCVQLRGAEMSSIHNGKRNDRRCCPRYWYSCGAQTTCWYSSAHARKRKKKQILYFHPLMHGVIRRNKDTQRAHNRWQDHNTVCHTTVSDEAFCSLLFHKQLPKRMFYVCFMVLKSNEKRSCRRGEQLSSCLFKQHIFTISLTSWMFWLSDSHFSFKLKCLRHFFQNHMGVCGNCKWSIIC